jgi:hypothetical protein
VPPAPEARAEPSDELEATRPAPDHHDLRLALHETRLGSVLGPGNARRGAR